MKPLRNVTPPAPEFIRGIRMELGLTMAQAADMAGLGHQPRWAEYENGTTTPKAQTWELFLLKANIHPIYRLTRRGTSRRRLEI